MIHSTAPTRNPEDQRMYEAEQIAFRSRVSTRLVTIVCLFWTLCLLIGVAAAVAGILMS